MGVAILLLSILAFLVLVGLGSAFRVIQQYEQGVVFRFGQVQLRRLRRPGLTVIVPIADRLQKVNMQTVAMNVPAQEGITEDNVSVRVDAVVYLRVIEPVKAIVNVQNYGYAVSQVAQTSLRSVIGKADMQQLLGDRETINAELRRIMDEITQDPWGVRVERVEIKDVSLPEGMKRSMARQAEAERERRARVITADGEFQASKRLAAAAEIMSQDPAALQLRLLQTVVEVSAEKNSTLVMPLPVELLRFFEKAVGRDSGGGEKEQAPDLGERLAKAEEVLATTERQPPIESADDVPPVIGLDQGSGIPSAVEGPSRQRGHFPSSAGHRETPDGRDEAAGDDGSPAAPSPEGTQDPDHRQDPGSARPS